MKNDKTDKLTPIYIALFTTWLLVMTFGYLSYVFNSTLMLVLQCVAFSVQIAEFVYFIYVIVKNKN